MRNYSKIIQAVFGTVWAIMPEKLEAIIEFIELKNMGVELSEEEIEARTNRRATSFKNVKGDIAVLPLYGVISQKMNLLTAISGGVSTEIFGNAFDDAMDNGGIGAIVIDVDSPGGSVFGVQELSQKIFDARGKKPIVAVTNSLNASAAYWISSAADEIVVTPGGEIGSVGVVAIHSDYSEAEKMTGIKTTLIRAGKYKTEGNPYEPLGDEATAALQARVDEYYEMFTSDLARNRDTTRAKVVSNYGEGRVVGAKKAIETSMADRIGTFEQVISDLSRPTRASQRSSASQSSKNKSKQNANTLKLKKHL